MVCLENFISVFGKIDHLILDNCMQSTKNEINKKFNQSILNIHETKMGNAQSFIFAMDIAIKKDTTDSVYFVEDDYIHQKGSLDAIEEGLSFGDYCTLYDHPDKYSEMYGLGEQCKLMRKNNRHWKTSISTTMTFACKNKTIKSDSEIFKSVCNGKQHPDDHSIFLRLGKIGRILVVSIPGMSLHTDITTNIMNINTIGDEIDIWALKLIADKMKSEIIKEGNENEINQANETMQLIGQNTKKTLVCLEILAEICEKIKLNNTREIK